MTLRGGAPLVASALAAPAAAKSVELSDGSRLEIARDARLEPLVTVTLAAVVLDERIALVQMAGGTLILAAVVLLAPARTA